jgi:hypothetical protein
MLALAMAVRGRNEMERDGTKFDRLAMALAEGDTVQAAAEKAGIGRTTAFRRLADPVFRQRIQTFRGDMIGRALGRMADAMTEGADVLRDLLKAQSESVRLGACRALLELGVKLRESVELEERLAALETRIAKGNDQ